jgi:hypothetical protein
MKNLTWAILLVSLSVMGCVYIPTPPPPTLTPTPLVVVTQPLPVPATATFTATPRPTMATLLPTSTLTPTLTPTSVDAGILTPLAPLPVNVEQVKIGFQEPWFTYLRMDEPPKPASRAATLFVLNIDNGISWEVTSACLDAYCEFAWTSMGQLLWLEAGSVFLADADGQNKRNLNAPTPITEIFGISATDVAILRGNNGTDLWRLYLPDGTFDAIADPQRNRNPIPDFVTQNDLLYFTADNTIAALAYDITPRTFDGDIQILSIPLEARATPTLLAAVPRLGYGGRSEPPPLPPVLLAGTSYWLSTEGAGIEGQDSALDIVLLNLHTQNVGRVDDLIPIEEQGYRFTNWHLSPERTWIAINLQPLPIGSSYEDYVYVAPVSTLPNGVILKGTVEGWHSNPSAMVIRERNGDINTLYWLSLEDNRKTLLFPNLEVYTYPTTLATQEAFFLQPSRLLPILSVVSPEGEIIAMTTLPGRTFQFDDTTHRQRVDPVYAAERRAYYVAGAPNLPEPDEQTYLWRWDISE